MRPMPPAVLCLLLVAVAWPLAAQPTLDVPVHVKRLSDRAIVVTLGDFAWSNQIVALASKKGLVVVDTSMSRSAQQLVNQAIGKAFGRSDVLYVINTHQHHDHTNGNQLYPGVPIVAHQECREGMRQDVAGIPDWLAARVKAPRQGFEGDLKRLDPSDQKWKAGREYFVMLDAVVREMETGHVPTYPTVTFTDRMTLDLGDMTLELYSLPAGHTRGDIVVHVPEESLLCVGDMIAEGWLPVLELQSAPDPGRFLGNWRQILASASGTRHVVMGHGFATVSSGPQFANISFETLAWRYEYLKALWESLLKARAEGRTVEEARQLLAIERAFPHLKDKRREIKTRDGAAVDSHLQNIDTMWAALEPRR